MGALVSSSTYTFGMVERFYAEFRGEKETIVVLKISYKSSIFAEGAQHDCLVMVQPFLSGTTA